MVLRSHPKPFSLKAATGPNPSIRSATRPQLQLRTVTGQRPDPHPASSSMFCDCTGTFYDEFTQQTMTCTACESWRKPNQRCDERRGKSGRKAGIQLCNFCHELLMAYFKKSSWWERLPSSALPPPRPPVPGQREQTPAEAAEARAEERAEAGSQASSVGSRGSQYVGVPPAAPTPTLDQQMMQQFGDLHRRLSTIEAMVSYVVQALHDGGFQIPPAPAGPPATSAPPGPPAGQPWRRAAQGSGHVMPPAPAGRAATAEPAGPPAAQPGRRAATGGEAHADPCAAAWEQPSTPGTFSMQEAGPWR